MKTTLEQTITVCNTQFAALTRQTIHCQASGQFLGVSASKYLVALLIGRGDQCTAFTPDGEAIGEAAVERLCPGAMAQFMRRQSPLKA